MILARVRRRSRLVAIGVIATMFPAMGPLQLAHAQQEQSEPGSVSSSGPDPASELVGAGSLGQGEVTPLANDSRDNQSLPQAGATLGAQSASSSSDVDVAAQSSDDKAAAAVPGANSSGNAATLGTDPSAAASTPIALPTGSDKSGVTSQAISIPQASGTIQGMGESFSAQLSTGIATFSVPFTLPNARGHAQPSLGLSYSSSQGFGLAGVGWEISVPFIARQTDRGIPGYVDLADWHAEQDRFVFNGGQELVPICTVSNDQCALALDSDFMPVWANGWQYFRPRVEGSFLRFFWSPDHLTWRVQDKSGVSMELGVPLDGSGSTGGLERNPDNHREIYKWSLVRQYDAYGAANPASGNPQPVNAVVYRYVQDGGRSYLSDIFDTTPANNPTTNDVTKFLHHTALHYEPRTDPTESYRSGWRIQQRLRLKRVDVSSGTFNDGADPRRLLRRYHLGYDATQHASLLTSVQVEGRCSGQEASAPEEDGEGRLPEKTSCARLPAMTFGYSHVTPFASSGQSGERSICGL